MSAREAVTLAAASIAFTVGQAAWVVLCATAAMLTGVDPLAGTVILALAGYAAVTVAFSRLGGDA